MPIEYLSFEDIFISLWNKLEEAKSLADLQDFQDDLLEAVVLTELEIDDLRHNHHRLRERRKELVDATQERTDGVIRFFQMYQAYQDELQIMKEDSTWQLGLLKMLGDTLAWRFFPRHVLRAMYQTSPPGPIAGKLGSAHELTLVSQVHREMPDAFALMHDLTHVLRMGDISIHGPFEKSGTVFEVKSSNYESKQRSKQIDRHKSIWEYLNTGFRVTELGEELRLIEGTIHDKFEWEALEKALLEALHAGHGSCESSDGIALYVCANIDLDDPNKILEAISEEWRGPNRLMIPFMTSKRLRISEPFMPMTMFKIDRTAIVDLIFERVGLFVVLNLTRLEESFETIGIRLVESSFDEESKETIVLENENGLSMRPIGQFLRVIYEGFSPTTFVQVCNDAYRQISESDVFK